MKTTRCLIAILLVPLFLVTFAVADGTMYTDNVVIVLDASGSMGEAMQSSGVSKMDAAKKALHEVLASLPDTTHVGLLVFSQNVRAKWMHKLGPQNPVELKAAIDSIRPGGGTPLGEYIKTGADALLAQRKAQLGYGTYRLLVVTDGEANDKNLVEKYTPAVIARGITMDVIGVDMKKAHTLATKVHSYRRADDPESLRQAVAEVFAEVSTNNTEDTTGEDAFDIIAGLPGDVAQKMIQALATSGNGPIGEKAKPVAPTRTKSSPTRPVAQPPVHVDYRSNGYPCMTKIVVVMVIVFVVAVIRKAKR